jgi:DNA-binding SARP family transcriptional activator/TolB-like protein
MSRIRVLRRTLPAPTGGQASQKRLSVDVLNGLNISVAGKSLAFANRKGRAILAYLTLENIAETSRERLAGVLWGDSSEHHARSSLRQTLMELREALEAEGCYALNATRSRISLARGNVELDLDAALAIIAGGNIPDPLLVWAAGGNLVLAGYEDLSPMFRDWVAAMRRSTQERLTTALRRGYENQRHSHSARRLLAEMLLRLDPLDESACRAVMQLAAQDGEIGIALRAYAALYEALGTELDMEPSEVTQALAVDVKMGHHQPAAQVADSGTSGVPKPIASLAHGGAPVVAVLPLHVIGSDALASCVAEGIVEDVVHVLAGLREPVVISNNSTRNFRGLELNIQSIAASLGAQYLVTGSARMAGEQVRIALELVEAPTGAVLWSNAYTVPDTTLFEVQERIAAGIANTLVPQVNAFELRRSRQQRWEDLGSYYLVLRARDLVFKLDRPAFEQAENLLHQAIARDPGYPAPHAALADWHSLRMFQGWSPDPARDVMALENAAQMAIRLDPCHARALALLGHNRTIIARRYHDATTLFERALPSVPMKVRHPPPGNLDLRARKDQLAHAHASPTD